MTTISNSFSAAGVSDVLQLQAEGEDVTVTLSGTYDAVVQLERDLGSSGLSWERVAGPWRTPNASVTEIYQTVRRNERLRLRAISVSSGSVDYSFGDGDKVIGHVRDEFGRTIRTTRQSGTTELGDLTVEGDTAESGDKTIAGNLSVTGNVGITGDLDIGAGQLEIATVAVTASAAELNKLAGATFSTAEANAVLAGNTATAASLNKGTIPLDITALREIATDDIQALAAHGGIMASDSTPGLARVNGATDKALRVTWAAMDVTEAQFPPVPWPHDLDPAVDVTVHFLAKMGGATDTPTIDVQAFESEGDTEMGGVTGALSATLQELTVTLLAADIAGHPGFLNLSLVPGTHDTDALHLYAAWVEYQRA